MKNQILNFFSLNLNYEREFIFLIFMFLSFFYFGLSRVPHICLMEEVFNLNCSFCDMTLSFHKLLEFELLESIRINFLSISILFYFTIKYLFKRFNYLKKIIQLDYVFLVLCIIQFIIKNDYVNF
jgi:hypothetical protein